MDIESKTKININFSGLFEKVKKEFKDDYFKLTFFYMAVYSVMSMVLVYGVSYLTNGQFEFRDLRSEVTIVSVTLMMTVATMAKKLKDDIVSNYWKLSKNNRRNKPWNKGKKS